MKEKIYDEKILPLMSQIIAICKEHQIAMHATFSFGDKNYCTTHLPDVNDPTMRMMRYTAFSHGNADTLISSLMKDGKKYGHSSGYLKILEGTLK